MPTSKLSIKRFTKQGVLFDDLGLEEEPGPKWIPLDFLTQVVRMTEINGEPWWVLVDVCQVLEIVNTRDSAARLDDDEKMTVGQTDGHSGQRGGAQSITLINESGLYNLIFRSDKPQAKAFRKWITSEVLPMLRKTGSYHLPVHKRVVRERRRLHCDTHTAIERTEQFKINYQSNGRLSAEGVRHRDWYNAGYFGAFNKTAQPLREEVGLSKDRSPLDRMSAELLSQNRHSKLIAERIIRERGVKPHKQALVLQTIARQQMEADKERLGPGTTTGVVDAGPRGMIHDFICSPRTIDN